MALASVLGLTAPPAGAATVIQSTNGYYLAAYRACYFQRDFYSDGWFNLRSWCYNNAGTVLVLNLNAWSPDWSHPIIQAGNGAGQPARVDIIMDDWWAFPSPNIATWPGTVREIDQTGPGYQLWYDKVVNPDFGGGYAWWGDQTLAVEFDNTDARVSWQQW